MMTMTDAVARADAADSGEPVLAAREVTKHFKVRGGPLLHPHYVHAVDEVSLSLYPGRITALVGESGCGKSTLARLCAQMYGLTDGSIAFDGREVHVTRGKAFRAYTASVQLMLQDPYGSFNPVATIASHLRRAIRIHHPKTSRAERDRIAVDLLGQVHLDPPEQFLAKYPHELSGGQLQRCSIARALAASPRVFLADEPVSSLDVSIRLGILNLLRELTEQRRVALLYVTHDIASARYFAADTAVMYAGHMIEYGDSESVTQTPAHPYTQLLIDSAPDPVRGTSAKSGRDLGAPPSLITPPQGCRFNPRCPFAGEVCRRELPAASDVGPGHWARCWLFGSAPDGMAGPTMASDAKETDR